MKLNKSDPRLVLVVLVLVFFAVLGLSLATAHSYGGSCNGSTCVLFNATPTSYHVTTVHFVNLGNGVTAIYCVEHNVYSNHVSYNVVVFHIVKNDGQNESNDCVAPEYYG